MLLGCTSGCYAALLTVPVRSAVVFPCHDSSCGCRLVHGPVRLGPNNSSRPVVLPRHHPL